jgi:hypothetical protein
VVEPVKLASDAISDETGKRFGCLVYTAAATAIAGRCRHGSW